MGRTSTDREADAARRFAHAAAALASEAVLAVGRFGERPPTAAATRALDLAARSAEDLERLAREGKDLTAAYELAATALEAAAVALAETKATPWVHRIPAPPRPEA